MSYTAPSGNAVDFTATEASYTPPAGNAVVFVLSNILTVGAQCEVLCDAVFSTPSVVSVDCKATISASAEFDATYKHVILVEGVVALGGDSLFLQPADVRVSAEVPLSFAALLSGAPMLRVAGVVPVSAQASFKVKRAISVAGVVRVSGQAQMRAASKLSVSAKIPVLCSARFNARDNRG